MPVELRALVGASPLRFSDVIEELRSIAEMANASERDQTGLAEACYRVEALLTSLREQFLEDVVVGHPTFDHGQPRVAGVDR